MLSLSIDAIDSNAVRLLTIDNSFLLFRVVVSFELCRVCDERVLLLCRQFSWAV